MDTIKLYSFLIFFNLSITTINCSDLSYSESSSATYNSDDDDNPVIITGTRYNYLTSLFRTISINSDELIYETQSTLQSKYFLHTNRQGNRFTPIAFSVSLFANNPLEINNLKKIFNSKGIVFDEQALMCAVRPLHIHTQEINFDVVKIITDESTATINMPVYHYEDEAGSTLFHLLQFALSSKNLNQDDRIIQIFKYLAGCGGKIIFKKGATFKSFNSFNSQYFNELKRFNLNLYTKLKQIYEGFKSVQARQLFDLHKKL